MSHGGSDAIAQDRNQGRSMVISRNGIVAAESPLAAQAGVQILERGGNAVDAAVAANAMMGLVAPMSNGSGGDLFAIVYDAKSGKLYGLNASGWAPAGLTIEFLKNQGFHDMPEQGVQSVTVPGAVDGWQKLLDRFGKKKLSEVLAPAIRTAEDGFPVTEWISGLWAANAEFLRGNEAAARTYLPDNKPPALGQIFRNADLARSLRLIAQGGRDAFYKGEIAKSIVETSRRHGGTLAEKDFAEFSSEWVDPISTTYRGWRVYEMPPNSQGLAALEMLNIMETFPLDKSGLNTAATLHTMIEAKKLAYADLIRYIGDPKFSTLPVSQLLSKEFATARAKQIDPNKANCNVGPATSLPGSSTIYLSTVDRDGNMVSLIQSNYRGMGSGIVVPGLGFMFQDRGELFSMDPQHANVYAPGKRPFHTIIPGFVMKDGKPWEAFGVMGGGMQPQGHVQVLSNQIDFGLNVQEAGDASRWQHEGDNEPTGEKMTESGGYVEVESGIPYETVRELRKKGHDVRFDVGGYGGYQAIKVEMHDGQRVYV
ncbi:MAG: gamma-glutamyltransferase, partial [Acidobacteria bacterium]